MVKDFKKKIIELILTFKYKFNKCYIFIKYFFYLNTFFEILQILLFEVYFLKLFI